MNIQQIKQILANEPDGAVGYSSHHRYTYVNIVGHVLVKGRESEGYLNPTFVRMHHSLADLSLILEMAELLKKLTSHDNCKKDIIHLISNADSLLSKIEGNNHE